MSQTKKIKYPRLKVYTDQRSIDAGEPATGRNTRVQLDGVPLNGCTYLKIECKPKNLVRVTIELLAQLDVDLENVVEVTEGYKGVRK